MDDRPPPPPASAASPSSTAVNAAVRPLRVLYADDMEPLRELLKIVLGKEGHHVEAVRDGTIALQMLEAEPQGYDLLITDHHMVEMNGLELVQRVRGLAFKGKILVFSSELSQEVTAAYLRLHVDRVLHKPIFPPVLRQLIRELFAAPA